MNLPAASNKIIIFILVCLTVNLRELPGAAAQISQAEPAALSSKAQEPLPYKYTANLYSRKFHRPRCPYSRMMAEYKRVRFHFRYQAVAQGYVPCRYCLPAVWTTVKATIRPQALDKNIVDKNEIDKEALDKRPSGSANTAPLSTADKQPPISTP